MCDFYNISEDDAVKIAQVLLESGADVRTPQADSSATPPFAKAIIRKKLKLAELFLNYGANLDKMSIGYTPSEQNLFDWLQNSKLMDYTQEINFIFIRDAKNKRK